MSAPPAPLPAHLLRLHSFPITCLAFSGHNERIYSGDTSGTVVITSTRSLRPIASWPAHTDTLLGIQEWCSWILTHGRDNKLHVWKTVEDLPSSVTIGGSATVPNLVPELCYSMDVNALNYCRFSLFTLSVPFDTSDLPPGRHLAKQEKQLPQALIALPNLVESTMADIWVLPSCQRVHAAVGTPADKSFSLPGRGQDGIIMALHVYTIASITDPNAASSSAAGARGDELRLLCAHESGGVVLRRYSGPKSHSVEGTGWDVIWKVKLHTEAIMSMRVSPDNSSALTVSVDHIIGRYNLQTHTESDAGVIFRTKHPGNSAIAIRHDGKVCAIAGWDGKVRLYSVKSMKPLGTLSYHKEGCQAVEFACPVGKDCGDGTDDELDEEDKEEKARWLVAGGKDTRISIWGLMSFTKGG
ncbi:hypothetical protein HGRIS_003762 [Hohenbuehelia grisea]|uniref:ASTRA-associated protein 1 n=1 Tax=Hohenbuehelia grisea TaxID=104357 RepID=A0ABR3JH13_9AGAR